MDRRSFIAALGLSGSVAVPAVANARHSAPSGELVTAIVDHRKARKLVELASQALEDLEHHERGEVVKAGRNWTEMRLGLEEAIDACSASFANRRLGIERRVLDLASRRAALAASFEDENSNLAAIRDAFAARQARHDAIGLDEALEQEESALLAVLAFPCRSEADAVAKARYVLDECRGMELDARHVMALCRSHLFTVA